MCDHNRRLELVDAERQVSLCSGRTDPIAFLLAPMRTWNLYCAILLLYSLLFGDPVSDRYSDVRLPSNHSFVQKESFKTFIAIGAKTVVVQTQLCIFPFSIKISWLTLKRQFSEI
jgi:hypothetical protein